MKNKVFSWEGLKFNLSDKDVYPPKPASLLLAKTAIKVIKPKETVLDMCTGCGIVAIAIAKFVPNTKVFASDVNPKAVHLTKLNAKRNDVKIDTRRGDLCKMFTSNKFDVITVHPPAVPYPQKKNWGMPNGMKTATDGGPDGSELVIRSIIEAKRCLKKNGRLLLLLPHWSNTKRAYDSLKKNYSNISELAKLEVEFFPAIEYNPNPEVLNYFYNLAKKEIIEIRFKNKKPYSTVSVIKIIKK